MTGKHVKVAISVPPQVLKRVETLSKKLKLSRSECFSIAVEAWSDSFQAEQQVKEYVRGYLAVPENPAETKAYEKAQASALSAESW